MPSASGHLHQGCCSGTGHAHKSLPCFLRVLPMQMASPHAPTALGVPWVRKHLGSAFEISRCRPDPALLLCRELCLDMLVRLTQKSAVTCSGWLQNGQTVPSAGKRKSCTRCLAARKAVTPASMGSHCPIAIWFCSRENRLNRKASFFN